MKTINRNGKIAKVELEKPLLLKDLDLLKDIKPVTTRCLVYNEKGELLVIQKTKNGKTHYSVPGGHCKDEETPLMAVGREVMEETGVFVAPVKEFARHYKIDKNVGKGNGFMAWWYANLGDVSHMKESYSENGYDIKPMWMDPVLLMNKPFKPEFMKKHVLNFGYGPLRATLSENNTQVMEEVYKC